jgi:hypothetical protein
MGVITAQKIRTGEIEAPPDAGIDQLLQIALGGFIDDDGDLWCIECNTPNECCTCEQEETDEEWTNRMIEDEALTAYDYDDDPKAPVLGFNLDGLKVTADDLEFCEDCGRSPALCDCATKDIP